MGWLGPSGLASWAEAQVGQGGLLFFFFVLFCFLFCIFFFFYFFSFSILINFSAFKDFIKLCFLYYNYPHNIQHHPNISVTAFEKNCCLH